MTSIMSLPNEITSQLFSILPIKDVIRCSKVCKSWHRIANDNELWKKLIPTIPSSHQNQVKEYLAKHIVYSEYDIQIFCNNLSERNFPATSFTLYSFNCTPSYSKAEKNILTNRIIEVETLPNSQGNLNAISLKICSRELSFFEGVIKKTENWHGVIMLITSIAVSQLLMT